MEVPLEYPEQTTIFDSVSRAFCCGDIAREVQSVSESTSMEDILQYLEDSEFDALLLVKDGAKVRGYIDVAEEGKDYQDLPKNEKLEFLISVAKTKAKPVTFDLTVPASLPLLDLPALLRIRPFFFVLDGNDVGRMVSYEDMNSLPMRLCLLSACIGIESLMIDVLRLSMKRKSIKIAGSISSSARVVKAINLYKEKYIRRKGQSEPSYIKVNLDHFLLCVSLGDKRDIFIGNGLDKDMDSSRSRFRDNMKQVEMVRDHAAHNDSVLEVLPDVEKMLDFLSLLRAYEERLKRIKNDLLLSPSPA